MGTAIATFVCRRMCSSGSSLFWPKDGIRVNVLKLNVPPGGGQIIMDGLAALGKAMIIIDDHIATRGDTGIKVVKNLTEGLSLSANEDEISLYPISISPPQDTHLGFILPSNEAKPLLRCALCWARLLLNLARLS